MRKFFLTIDWVVYVEDFSNTGNPYFFGKIKEIIEAKTIAEAKYKGMELAKKKAYGFNRYQDKAIKENKIYFDIKYNI